MFMCDVTKRHLNRAILFTMNIGINHGFQCSNIRLITMNAFEYKAVGRLSKPLRSDPANV